MVGGVVARLPRLTTPCLYSHDSVRSLDLTSPHTFLESNSDLPSLLISLYHAVALPMILLDPSPTASLYWPRLFQDPTGAASLTELWGKRWHQMYVLLLPSFSPHFYSPLTT